MALSKYLTYWLTVALIGCRAQSSGQAVCSNRRASGSEVKNLARISRELKRRTETQVPATVGSRVCNRRKQRLQPYVFERHAVA